MKKTTLKINGMHCGSCAGTVNMLLTPKEGIKKALVDFKKGKADIEYDEEKISIKEIIKAIKEAGYTASI